MADRFIRVQGVRVHNLKNVSVDLPIGQLIAITGVSGSGKSSLAFDTLYAEGQRRYLETFTAYTRQFLERLEKPDADRIDGIPASVAVAQQAPKRSSRSTVGSMTEIDDHLAVLFARLGSVFCQGCGEKIEPSSVGAVSKTLAAMADRTRYQIAFPMEIVAGTDRNLLADSLRESGFLRVRIDNETHMIESGPIPGKSTGMMDVIVDRLVSGTETEERREDSIRTAFERGYGRCRILTDDRSLTFHRDWICPTCGIEHAEPEPSLFRPNSPRGACDSCEGFGRVIDVDYDRIIPDHQKSLREGAIAPFQMPAYKEMQDGLEKHGPKLGLRLDVPWAELTSDEKKLVIDGKKSKGMHGIKDLFEWLEKKTYKMHIRVFLSRWRSYRTCDACQGRRLKPVSLAVKLEGQNIAQLSEIPLENLKLWLDQVEMNHAGHPAVVRVVKPMNARLNYLIDVGLGYLTLSRAARTLSGGEAQRVGLTTALGSGLVNMLYVLDEPTAGLHSADVGKLLHLVQALRDRGNTVVAVEHDADLIRASDYLVDLGPGAGENGGQILFAGATASASVELAPESVTIASLMESKKKRKAVKPSVKRPMDKGWIEIKGCRGNHLKSIDIKVPIGALTVIAGVSGSGKTTFMSGTFAPALCQELGQEADRPEPFEKLTITGEMPGEAILVDGSAIGRSSRSNPATFLKILDEIRKVFAEMPEAKTKKFTASRFSFNNAEGRCSTCEGNGYQTIEMQFLADVMIRCPDCKGARYKPEVLAITYRGKSIADVLEMTGREAWSFFRTKTKVQTKLRWLMDVGLDYLRLGQSTSTLSGGEAQRLKLAAHLATTGEAVPGGSKAGKVIFLDEPTTGLHSADVLTLRRALDGLVDRGHTLVIVEHDLDLIRQADWVIELGPGAGHHGGEVVFMGRPEDLKGQASPTGRIL